MSDKLFHRAIGAQLKLSRQTFQKVVKEETGEPYPFPALADRLGVTTSRMRRWELGTAMPTLPEFLSVCEAYCITPSDFLDYLTRSTGYRFWELPVSVPKNA